MENRWLAGGKDNGPPPFERSPCTSCSRSTPRPQSSTLFELSAVDRTDEPKRNWPACTSGANRPSTPQARHPEGQEPLAATLGRECEISKEP